MKASTYQRSDHNVKSCRATFSKLGLLRLAKGDTPDRARFRPPNVAVVGNVVNRKLSNVIEGPYRESFSQI